MISTHISCGNGYDDSACDRQRVAVRTHTQPHPPHG
jgi:hypothetical protein